MIPYIFSRQTVLTQFPQDFSRNVVFVSATGGDQDIRYIILQNILCCRLTELLPHRHISSSEILSGTAAIQFPILFRGGKQIVIDHTVHRKCVLLHIIQQIHPAKPVQCLQISIRHRIAVHQKNMPASPDQSFQRRKLSFQVGRIRPKDLHRHVPALQQFRRCLLRAQKAEFFRMLYSFL